MAYKPKAPTEVYYRPPKTKAEKWGASPVDYSGMSTSEMRSELNKIRRSTNRRIRSLEQDSKLYSYAANQFTKAINELYISGRAPSAKSMTRNQLEKEIAQHHRFWASKTATKEGAKDELLRQSARIFGVDENGRVNRVMTVEESVAFWRAHDEFERMYPESARYDSNRVQSMLGEILTRNGKNSSIDLVKIAGELHARLEADFGNPYEPDISSVNYTEENAEGEDI